LFKHSQLESVKADIARPEYAAMPLHGRVQRAIKQMILDGVLAGGKPLPASRALAKSLAISRDTVEAAYSQLHAEGFILRKVGSGSYVAEMPEWTGQRRTLSQRISHPLRMPSLSQRGRAAIQSGGVRSAQSAIPFAHGLPETRTFPLAVWERMERQVCKEMGTASLQAGDPQGVLRLRQAIADHINLERGAKASADRVLVLTSSQQALALCANTLFDPSDAIFIEDPVYHGARKAFDASGLHCVPVRVDEDGMLVDQIIGSAQPAKAVFLTPSHQFPTGTTLALERRLALVEWANKNNAWIIEDDYDSEFHYAGKPTACVQGLDPYERTIYIGTFTKSLFPGLRLGYAVLPKQLVEPMTLSRTLWDGHSATIPQYTLAKFMENGHFGSHIRAMRSLYAARLNALVNLVSQHLSEHVEPRRPSGGLQMPCILKPGLVEAAVLAAARAEGIELMGLSSLWSSGNGEAGFLLGFAAYDPCEMEVAVLKLARIIAYLRRR
jgi:GntR family transcriptional regulator/MocR family aminotransferase